MVACVGHLAPRPHRSRDMHRPALRDVGYVRPFSFAAHIPDTNDVLYRRMAAMGIVDTLDSCSAVAFSTVSVFDITYTPSGSFYQSDLFGLAASVLSLATNMVATILIGCKAWCVCIASTTLQAYRSLRC